MKKFVMLIGSVVLGTQLGWAAGGGGSYSGDSGGSSSSGSSYSTSMDKPQNLFSKVYELIEDKKFDAAYKELENIEAPGKQDDLYNLLGFTARKSGNLSIAAKHYEKALDINGRHVGALQYQGELFITLGEFDSAKQNLAKIEKICWLFACEEEKLLKTALELAIDG